MSSSERRRRLVEFLIQSAQQLEASPIVKYTSLSLFADRFYASLSRFVTRNNSVNWLLQPVRESNLQLFALISIWISSKIHDSRTLSIKNLKFLGDENIKEQHFTTRDYLEARLAVFYAWRSVVELLAFRKVLTFEIGTGNIAFVFLEELLLQLRGIAKVGELVNFEACLDIIDLLYEKEETSALFNSPCSLAASVLVASYVITVPTQRWEFPVLSWVNFVTSCEEEDIVGMTRDILKHVFEPCC